jgi:hypothetical protein
MSFDPSAVRIVTFLLVVHTRIRVHVDQFVIPKNSKDIQVSGLHGGNSGYLQGSICSERLLQKYSGTPN